MEKQNRSVAAQIGIGIAIGVGVAAVVGFVSWLGGFLPAVWALLVSTPQVPVWLLLTAAPFTIAGLVWLVRSLRPSNSVHLLDYREDDMLGARWRWHWEWTSSGWRAADLWPSCMTDDTPLVVMANRRDDFGNPSRITMHCETCGTDVGPMDGDADDFIAKASRQIDRKLASGECIHAIRSAAERKRKRSLPAKPEE